MPTFREGDGHPQTPACIDRSRGCGKRIYVYGASTKGNVLLQYLRLDASLIKGCDRNPIKWGRRTPATNIPIVSEDAARADADYFLVLPWSFKDEFLAREAAFGPKAESSFSHSPISRSVKVRGPHSGKARCSENGSS